MSAARPTASADSTRRQLDELDALLQRMLALPVAPPDDDPILPEDPSTDTALAVAEPPTPMPPPMAVRVVVTPLATVLEPPLAPASPVPAEPEPPALPRPRRRRFWPRPLLWSNRVFDRCTDPLGSPGRWLRGRKGRTFLGIVGLLCLAAALAVVAMDWAGWIW